MPHFESSCGERECCALAQVHAWLLFDEGEATSALCVALAEGSGRADVAERALSGTLESLLRTRAATGRADIRTGCGTSSAANTLGTPAATNRGLPYLLHQAGKQHLKPLQLLSRTCAAAGRADIRNRWPNCADPCLHTRLKRILSSVLFSSIMSYT